MINIAESRYGVDELLVADAEADERRWLPFGDSAFSLPLLFDVRGGSWVSLFKAKGAGTIERHRHSNPVTGWTLEGTWGYRERDWIARRGTLIFEPAGDIHTLYVHPEAGHMKALFHVFGPLVYLDEDGNAEGYDDVLVRLDRYAAHCKSVGLGDEFVRTLIR